MQTAEKWLEFFYEHFFDGENIHYESPQDIELALAVAADWRPTCLVADRQNQAQAHYAAYVLEFRRKIKDAKLSVSSAMNAIVAGPAIEIQEGSTRVKYSEKAQTNTSVAQIQSTMTGPGTAYAAWFALWSICAPGVADPVTGVPATKPGGIITAYGLMD